MSFREILGLRQEQIPELVQTANEHLNRFTGTSPKNGSVKAGLSPHAPYSVHPDLYESLIDVAVSRNVPVAMHLAETTDEIELLHDGKGAFVEFLQQPSAEILRMCLTLRGSAIFWSLWPVCREPLRFMVTPLFLQSVTFSIWHATQI